MELVEGTVTVGGERFPDTDAFVDALGAVGDEHGVTVQAFDARLVVSARHLGRALELADRERARGDGIARDRAVEVLLYAAGRRQIRRALAMGVGEGETPAVVLVAAAPDGSGDEAAAAAAVGDLLASRPTLGEYDPERVRDFFGIGERELAATDATLADLVLERVALLVVER
ncbi:KEOPS complex subunit Cgi121 [Halosegnis marinus]|uniref:KEOPS complex subunit Cgi121 n=1 Tax=Halosegnis marinus TaxID=3034023 RepID=A0ABD5ZPD0_9EURY|nr:KEOPS complex subunit Cgi121 [Halosegnis sp. DT85]